MIILPVPRHSLMKLFLLSAFTTSITHAQPHLSFVSDIATLRPQSSVYVDAGIMNPAQALLFNKCDPGKTELRDPTIDNCVRLFSDETAPYAVRRWATLVAIRLKTVRQDSLDDVVSMAQMWLNQHPEDYEINLRLQCYLANTYVLSHAGSGANKLEVLENLMEPIFSKTDCFRPSTLEAGILYGLLTVDCHNRILQEWRGANAQDIQTQDFTISLCQKSLTLAEAELSLYRKIYDIWLMLSTRPELIPNYSYYGSTVSSSLESLGRAIQIELKSAQDKVSICKDNLERELAVDSASTTVEETVLRFFLEE